MCVCVSKIGSDVYGGFPANDGKMVEQSVLFEGTSFLRLQRDTNTKVESMLVAPIPRNPKEDTPQKPTLHLTPSPTARARRLDQSGPLPSIGVLGLQRVGEVEHHDGPCLQARLPRVHRAVPSAIFAFYTAAS